jgi:hypothetical protein
MINSIIDEITIVRSNRLNLSALYALHSRPINFNIHSIKKQIKKNIFVFEIKSAFGVGYLSVARIKVFKTINKRMKPLNTGCFISFQEYRQILNWYLDFPLEWGHALVKTVGRPGSLRMYLAMNIFILLFRETTSFYLKNI